MLQVGHVRMDGIRKLDALAYREGVVADEVFRKGLQADHLLSPHPSLAGKPRVQIGPRSQGKGLQRLPARAADQGDVVVLRHHPGGAQFTYGDGSTRFLSESLDYLTLARLAYIPDGEVIAEAP